MALALQNLWRKWREGGEDDMEEEAQDRASLAL